MWWDGRDTEKELEEKRKELERLVNDANEHIGRLRRKFEYYTSTYTRPTRKI